MVTEMKMETEMVTEMKYIPEFVSTDILSIAHDWMGSLASLGQ